MDGVILSIIEIILLGLGLAMDASAVSMTNGMTMKPMKLKGTLATAFAFGLFQGVMPLIGYFAGSVFAGYMAAVDHWIALILLGFIGGKMLWDALKKEEEIVPVARKLFLPEKCCLCRELQPVLMRSQSVSALPR